MQPLLICIHLSVTIVLCVIFLSVTYEVPVLTSALFQQTPLCDFIGLFRSIFKALILLLNMVINRSKEVYMANILPETEVSDGNITVWDLHNHQLVRQLPLY